MENSFTFYRIKIYRSIGNESYIHRYILNNWSLEVHFEKGEGKS